ncbi:adenosylcobinamide-GDP ribazoletransferase [Paracoccus sp. (in: a-proteobacteria)]|uniref:adenosylcobinamide-GDP ribazoletransferase n=1 Tax=Paracoccus sp. TaxID=267 RepID=UPI0035B41A62
MARLQQLLLAIVFLTRLPLGRFLPPQMLPLASALWAFPLAGGLVGALAGLPLLMDGPPPVLAALSFCLSVWLTGALHEDALADFADAAGGRTPEDRLRIMRDSHIGSYGVMALVCTSALRIAALTQVGPMALVAAATGGRTAIVLAMATLPPARRDGLGHAAGHPTGTALLAAPATAVLLLLPLGFGGIAAAVAGLAAALLVMRQARRWIGGQTGDVLGAVSVACETAMLTVLALVTQGPTSGIS